MHCVRDILGFGFLTFLGIKKALINRSIQPVGFAGDIQVEGLFQGSKNRSNILGRDTIYEHSMRRVT